MMDDHTYTEQVMENRTFTERMSGRRRRRRSGDDGGRNRQRSPGGTATWGELLRTLGFAQAPGVLYILAVMLLAGVLIALSMGMPG